MKATEIFTPGVIPSYTYCEREDKGIAKRLLEAIDTEGTITCVFGPSKSGKTVLCEKVIGQGRIVSVTGGSAQSEKDFWLALRRKLSLPDSQTKSTSSTGKLDAGIEGGGKVGIPILAGVEAKASLNAGIEKSSNAASTYEGLQGTDLLLAASTRVIVVDDFHYIPYEKQKLLATQFKEASYRGAKIVIVSVPHRSDDAILANQDLRGRVLSIEVPLWTWAELQNIPLMGFPLLNCEIESSLLKFLVVESIFSPQLMQTLCLELCRLIDVNMSTVSQKVIDLNEEQRVELLLRASKRADCDTSFALLVNAGTKPQSQKLYGLVTGDESSLNRLVLRAIGKNELLEIPYGNLLPRIMKLIGTTGPMPTDEEIESVLVNMDSAIKTQAGDDKVIDWNPIKRLITILDPHFLHYLRGSDCWVKFL